MPMYLVEVVQMNRIIKIHARTPNYDTADDRFSKLKRGKATCREVRMLKIVQGDRVLLKYVIRVKQRAAPTPD